jgi:hypothetical protein
MRIRTSKFRKQMEAIRQLGISVISLEDFIAWKRGEKDIPEKSILLTFDDGWKSVYTDAFPILKEFGYPFTLYLYKNYVDGGGKALTTPMIQEMIAAGATIGSHSVSHPYPITVKKFSAKKARTSLRRVPAQGNGRIEALPRIQIRRQGRNLRLSRRLHTPRKCCRSQGVRLHHMPSPCSRERSNARPDETLPRYMILGNYDKIFEFATTFRDAANPIAAPEGAIAGMIQTTPYPVSPEAGAIINSRLPEISADLSKLDDIDPSTLVMKVSGFGEVPANFAPKRANSRGRSTAASANRPARFPSRGRTPGRQKPEPRSAGPSSSTANPPTSPTASNFSISDFSISASTPPCSPHSPTASTRPSATSAASAASPKKTSPTPSARSASPCLRPMSNSASPRTSSPR